MIFMIHARLFLCLVLTAFSRVANSGAHIWLARVANLWKLFDRRIYWDICIFKRKKNSASVVFTEQYVYIWKFLVFRTDIIHLKISSKENAFKCSYQVLSFPGEPAFFVAYCYFFVLGLWFIKWINKSTSK